MAVFGEVQYEHPDGNVHSDIDFTRGPIDAKARESIHAQLDEWLDNQPHGAGWFVLGLHDFVEEIAHDPEFYGVTK